MSIQSKYDLTLLGNIIVDDVYCIPKWREGTSGILQSHYISVGGIGNIVRALPVGSLKMFVEANVGCEYSRMIDTFFDSRSIETFLHGVGQPTSHALILSDLERSERTSFVNWGCAAAPFVPSNKMSRWTHISYLDTSPMFDLSQIRSNSDILSADLCLSHMSNDRCKYVLEQLQYLDYLFASETELGPLVGGCTRYNLKHFVARNKLNCLILHTKYKTIIVKNDVCNEVLNTHELIRNVNVLGAGDAYCANFILHQLTLGGELDVSAGWAHQQANSFILAEK